MKPESPIQYRADIDGLRALAVIAAILFHAKVPGFSGGYVGVDVFFVISGYLITELLTSAKNQSASQLLYWFYLRRCRRILPALLFMMSLVSLAAMVLMPPEDLARFGRSLAMNAAMLGNIASSRDGNYFAFFQPLLPLSHLWSIAVEEQFYIVYPLALVLLTKGARRHRLTLVLILGASSLALCLLLAAFSHSQYYYLAPARAWELLLGAALALHRWPDARRWYGSQWAALAAIVALVATTCLYGPQTPYPGIYALLPCISTAILIGCGRHGNTPVSRLLAAAPLVFIGRMSYSLYLWHRPILSFYIYSQIKDPTASQLTLLLIAIAVISIASWYLIEQPLRRRQMLAMDRTFIRVAATLMITIGFAGFAMWRTHGLPQRFSPDIRRLLASVGDPDAIDTRCITLPQADIDADRLCTLGPPGNNRRHILVWGDSHANALQPAFRSIGRSIPASISLASRGACAPLLDVQYNPLNPVKRTGCPEFNASMLRAAARQKPDLVVLAAYWNLPPSELQPYATNTVHESEPTLTHGMRRLLDSLPADIPVCIVLDVPKLRIIPQYNVALALRAGWRDRELGLSRAEALQQQAFAEQSLRRLAGRPNLYFADLKDALCAGEKCAVILNGKSLYHDNTHLSPTGSEFIASALAPCLTPLIAHGP